MATLIIKQDGRRRAAELDGRVIIGRRPGSHIVIADPAVSRFHAWIGRENDRYFVADSGSRTGTIVNGKRIEKTQFLEDGDQIRIGPAVMTFRAKGSPASALEKIEFKREATAPTDGRFIDCGCGAPLWAPLKFSGRVGQCRYCRQKVEIPAGFGLPSHAPPPAGEADAPEQTFCGACQCEINTGETTHRCPSCGVTFHLDCWNENRGCSSYGCDHVGILDQNAPADDAAEAPATEAEASDPVAPEETPAPQDGVPWEDLLLPGAVVAALAGLLTFGVPAALAAVGIGIFRFRARRLKRPALVTASLILAALAVAAGVGMSWFWWLAPVVRR